jgi:predicted dehydrogenase
MADIWRALIVGCGRIAGDYNRGADDAMVLTHALAYRRHQGFALAGCVDPDRQARETFMRKWDVARGYATLEDALASDRYDIASICSPTGTHIAAADCALRSGIRAIFVEKPVDADPQGARRLAKSGRSLGVPIAVNFTRRFDPSMRALREEISSGRLGGLLSVVGWFGRGTLNNASHLIDLAIYLTGRRPRLIALGAQCRDLDGADPSVASLLDLDGITMQIATIDARAYTRFELEIACERGVVAIEDGGLAVRRRSVSPSAAFPGIKSPERGEWASTRYGEALLVALGEIRDAAERGAALACDLDTAAVSIEAALAIRSAALEVRP